MKRAYIVMNFSLPSRFHVQFPPWLKSDHPGLRAFVALFTVAFIVVQVFGNLPASAIRNSLQPVRVTFDELGLYERGWGMFAATNTNTSVVRNELTYADGSHQEIQYIYLAPGYGLSVWNEVTQDLQFDDNNDKQGRYLSGFLDYTCKQYDTHPNNPLISVAFQQQVTRIPAPKETAANTNPFATRRIRNCQMN